MLHKISLQSLLEVNSVVESGEKAQAVTSSRCSLKWNLTRDVFSFHISIVWSEEHVAKNFSSGEKAQNDTASLWPINVLVFSARNPRELCPPITE